MAGTEVTRSLRHEFDGGQIELIKATVAKGLTNPELGMFLEVAARHDLDPFTKQIWAIKIQGVVQPVVSRDGLLSIANRHTPKNGYEGDGEFMGCQSNVVHEHDEFDFTQVVREDGSKRIAVHHSPRDAEGSPSFGGKDGKARGEMIGAWATVARKGHDDVFFMAYREEYDKKANVWLSHPHAMMVKCAEGMALRKAFSVSGVLAEGEEPKRHNLTDTTDDEATEEIHWPEDEEQADELRKRFDALNYRRAKVRLMVNACQTPEDFIELQKRLDVAVDEQNAVVDAEVVEPEPA